MNAMMFVDVRRKRKERAKYGDDNYFLLQNSGLCWLDDGGGRRMRQHKNKKSTGGFTRKTH